MQIDPSKILIIPFNVAVVCLLGWLVAICQEFSLPWFIVGIMGSLWLLLAALVVLLDVDIFS